jgi:Leucine-rich repeat (LRR) protein
MWKNNYTKRYIQTMPISQLFINLRFLRLGSNQLKEKTFKKFYG